MNKVIEERLLKAKMNRLAIEDEMKTMERSDTTRKIQIALTNMEQSELWLESALKEENPLNVKSYA